MKFTGSLSTLCVVLPVVLQASAAPTPFNFGNIFGNRGGASSAAAASAAPASAASAPPAAASAASAAPPAAASAAAAAPPAAGNGAAGNGTAAAAAPAAGGDPQTSLTLDPSVIGPNLAKNGLAGGAEVGQAPSLTSTNNFINSCIGKTITNGLQIQAGSCNPVPMGDIPNKGNQPASKFQFPTNLANIGVNKPFTVKMAIQGMQTGAFVNPNTNYFAAPQQLNGQGQIIGHSHFVIQALPSITSTQPLDPTVFAFFQGLNAPAANNQLSASVTKGLPAGTYRVFSINTAANHQPVIGPVAQHGSFDDAVYFTVGDKAAKDALKAIGARGGGFDFNAVNVPGAANGTAAAAAAPAASAAASAAAAAAPAASAPAASAPAASAAPAAANATTPGGRRLRK